MRAQLTQEEVLRRAHKVHGGRWIYDKFEYNGMHNKSCIICPNHGEFWQTPNSHLRLGSGCPKCSGREPVHPDLSHIETPAGSKAVPVGTKGDYALVDDEDYERVMEYNWHLTKNGYAHNNVVGRMHRFIMNPPDNLYIDHVFHNKLDNRKEQLRVCTMQQNGFNSKARGGSSIYKGVYWDKSRDKWVAKIEYNKKGRFLGFLQPKKKQPAPTTKRQRKYKAILHD